MSVNHLTFLVLFTPSLDREKKWCKNRSIAYRINRIVRYCCPSIVAPIFLSVEGRGKEPHQGEGVDGSLRVCCSLS